MSADRPVKVLLAEDSEDDRFLMTSAWKEAGIPDPLALVVDGLAAVDRLAASPPDLLILDLKMPGQDGFQVLQWVRLHERLRGLPVIILTASAQPGDVAKAYALGACAFLVKPTRYEELVEIVRGIKAFWLESNRYAP